MILAKLYEFQPLVPIGDNIEHLGEHAWAARCASLELNLGYTTLFRMKETATVRIRDAVPHNFHCNSPQIRVKGKKCRASCIVLPSETAVRVQQAV